MPKRQLLSRWAPALAEAGHKVLVMDLDPQANLTLALGVEPGAAAITSSHILIESARLEEAVLKTEIGNLDLIPSDSTHRGCRTIPAGPQPLYAGHKKGS